MKKHSLAVIAIALFSLTGYVGALSTTEGDCMSSTRRKATATLIGTPLGLFPLAAQSIGSDGLAARLSKRDAAALKNSAFNIPPKEQKYPDFMRGEWEVESNFRGFLFPSTTIPKSDITRKTDIPGFQKCSIAQVCDVGRESTKYLMKIDPNSGVENRIFNFAQVIDSNLGYKGVEEVLYDGASNSNRISISFVKNRTRNAERIELFCNARESELVPPADGRMSIFVCSEYVRQVTFSLSTEFGVARQVIGNYAHFWTWREQPDKNFLTGNLLTCAYLDPNDALFFQEPAKPVAVYSHDLKASRVIKQ